MGGFGSGRLPQHDAKPTTRDYRSIDVRLWSKRGLLRPNLGFDWNWVTSGAVVASIAVRTAIDRVTVAHRHNLGNRGWTGAEYAISIDRTTCHFGGSRPWFLCPAVNCGRRVAILYNNGQFCCRHCCGLTYESQREQWDARAIARADKIRARLQWPPGVINERGHKPKGMHWRTFRQLQAQHDFFALKGLGGIADRLAPVHELADRHTQNMARCRLHSASSRATR